MFYKQIIFLLKNENPLRYIMCNKPDEDLVLTEIISDSTNIFYTTITNLEYINSLKDKNSIINYLNNEKDNNIKNIENLKKELNNIKDNPEIIEKIEYLKNEINNIQNNIKNQQDLNIIENKKKAVKNNEKAIRRLTYKNNSYLKKSKDTISYCMRRLEKRNLKLINLLTVVESLNFKEEP